MSEFKVGDHIVMIKSYAYSDIRVIKELLDGGKTCKTTDGRFLRLSLTSGYLVHRIATHEEIAAGHRIDDIKMKVSFGFSLMSPERIACVDLTPKPVFELETLDKPENHISLNCKVGDV